jgi:hypothetical protein
VGLDNVAVGKWWYGQRETVAASGPMGTVTAKRTEQNIQGKK